jgi:putative Mg2+ transporter-C (MgtC) family protein
MELKIIFLRLLITFVLAIIFGIERQQSHKPVGFGTFVFVAIGSCSLSLIALDLGKENPLPLLSAIVTGIGFLGAGALIKTTDKIFGFTTAASIWLFAIMGLIIGTGYYKMGLIVYFFVWICIFTDKYLENGSIISYQKRINLELNNTHDEEKITNLFSKFKVKKYKLLYKRINKRDKKLAISYLVESSGKNLRELVESLEKMPSFVEINLE